MNVQANIDRRVYDAITLGVAYVHTMRYYSSISASLVHLMYQIEEDYHLYIMSRDLYESIVEGACWIYRMTPTDVQLSYDTTIETKQERIDRLKRWMEEAVESEDYEEAARLRDLINR